MGVIVNHGLPAAAPGRRHADPPPAREPPRRARGGDQAGVLRRDGRRARGVGDGGDVREGGAAAAHGRRARHDRRRSRPRPAAGHSGESRRGQRPLPRQSPRGRPRSLEATAHRPWPPPTAPWSQAQTRRDVLFAHWRVGLGELARLLPPDLPLDTHDGDAWLGFVAVPAREPPSPRAAAASGRRLRAARHPHVRHGRRPPRGLALLGRRLEPAAARGCEARAPAAGLPRADVRRRTASCACEASRDGL